VWELPRITVDDVCHNTSEYLDSLGVQEMAELALDAELDFELTVLGAGHQAGSCAG
jgi:hypothetical protein